jgi:ribonuclease P protein component
MIQSSYKLNTRAVHFLLRRGQRRHGQWCTIIYTKQSRGPARFAVHIAKKASKYATKRNICKRAIYAGLHDMVMPTKNSGLFFVIVNKKYLDQWVVLLASADQKTIKKEIGVVIAKDLQLFLRSGL